MAEIAAIITALSPIALQIIKSIRMGSGPSKSDYESLKIRNANLAGEILRVQKQMEELVESTRKEEKMLAKMSDYFKEKPIQIRYTNKFGFIGPKGMGKTTFIWMHGRCEKPQKVLDDGTKEILYNSATTVDTIGIPMTLEHLLRLMALFLINEVPNSLYLFGNDRITEPILLLSHLGIEKCYFVCLDLKYIYKTVKAPYFRPADNTDDCYDMELYNDLIKNRSMLIPVKFGQAPPAHNCFKPLLDKMFPSGKVELDNLRDDSFSAIKKRICILIYRFHHEFGGNQLMFMNAMI